MEITNDAKKLLLSMYKEYQRRRKDGMQRSSSMSFGSGKTVQELLLPDESPEDVDDYLWELSRAGYVVTKNADNTVWHCALTTEAIQKIEKLPADTIKSVAEFISHFIP